MSEFDVFLADCPARTTLAVVGDTWSVVVIMALGERPRRYSELLERIGGISKKMLTQTLHKLQRNGLLEREAAVYTLTDLGASLLPVVGALAAWAEAQTDALLEAQLAAV
jgi:DNA-binding HxlR family transcriptional regulator